MLEKVTTTRFAVVGMVVTVTPEVVIVVEDKRDHIPGDDNAPVVSVPVIVALPLHVRDVTVVAFSDAVALVPV